MNSEQKQSMREYIVKIEGIAHEAQRLHDSIKDEPYRRNLEAEIEGYRELIALWKQRLEEQA